MDAKAEAEKRYPDVPGTYGYAAEKQIAFEAGAVWALRDAADEAQIRLGGEVSGHTSTYSVRQWLHRRADRIERGE